MNRKVFMTKLSKSLKNMPTDERDSALEYYNEYFDEAGFENEDAVIAELGDPVKLAALIRSEALVKSGDAAEEQGKKRPVGKTVSAVFLGICAAPIALPLTAMALVIVAAIFLLAIILIACIGGMAVLFAGVGALQIIAGIAVVFQNPMSTVFFIGNGLGCMGAGILFALLVRIIAIKSFQGIRRMAKSLVEKRKKQ